MDKIEYLLFIPLLLYGIALNDLFGEYKRFFNKDHMELKYMLTIVALSETSVFNVYDFYTISNILPLDEYYMYWYFISQPIIFMIMVEALTIKTDITGSEKIGEHFTKQITKVFLLFSLFIFSHFLPSMNLHSKYNWIRFLAIGSCFLFAVTKKSLFFYFFIAVWLVSLFFKFKLHEILFH